MPLKTCQSLTFTAELAARLGQASRMQAARPTNLAGSFCAQLEQRNRSRVSFASLCPAEASSRRQRLSVRIFVHVPLHRSPGGREAMPRGERPRVRRR